jgi:hypothetical protein
MRADRRQNGSRMPALVGGFVAVSAAAFLALGPPMGADHPAPNSHTGSPGSSVTGTRSAAPQSALHTVTTTAVRTVLRLAEPGGCPPAWVEPNVAPQPTEPPSTPAGAAVVGSRLPLRILLCTWLN